MASWFSSSVANDDDPALPRPTGRDDCHEQQGKRKDELVFQKRFDFKQRQHESKKMREKYENKSLVPIVVERSAHAQSDVPLIASVDKDGKAVVGATQQAKFAKFLVPSTFTLHQFQVVLRKRIHLDSQQALTVAVCNQETGKLVFPTGATVIGQIDRDFAHPDGFLYMTYMGENTFG